MAYRVPYSDNTDKTKPSIVVPDKEINIDTSLALVGKNVYDYGQPIATNFLHLLENFACPEDADSPGNPDIVKCEVLARPVQGQIWYNSTTENFHYWDQEWKFMPAGSIRTFKILDTTGFTQTVSALMDEGNVIGVISDVEFTINDNDPNVSYFDEILNGEKIIKRGITLKDGMMFHGTATSAQYADLAEMYKSDKMYSAGTVVRIGGLEEVTQTVSPYSDEVFGIVSTDPAYLMNSGCPGVAVALEGRVPCKVIGKVNKGDRLVSSDIPGIAMVAESGRVTWKNQVGRAIEDKKFEEIGLVEVVVGAK